MGTGAGTATGSGAGTHAKIRAAQGRLGGGRIDAVGAESQYANVISQVGGRYVSVTAIMSNPNTDPHAFEASPKVAQAIGAARLVVQNGAGYDTFMNRIESASPSPGRRVIDVQRLIGLPGSSGNPHLWYDPATMPRLARTLAGDLSALAPRHASYFAARLDRLDASLDPLRRAIARFRRLHHGAPVATTEPVGDYLLAALGARDLTPSGMQADVMNGVDPAPQDIGLETSLLDAHRVRAFLYNRQVTDTLTQAFLALAERHRVPVVGLYETMPSGYDYQSWMLATVRALDRAVADGRSTMELR